MIGRLRLALRQWRRTLLGTLLLVIFMLVCIGLGYERDKIDFLHHPLGWLAMFLAGLIIAGSLTIIGAFFVPGLLPLIELWGISLIVGATTFAVLDSLPWLPDLNGLANCAVLIAVYLLVHKLLYGDWQAGVLPTKPVTTKRSIRLASDPKTVWNALRPDPARPNDHYWTGTSFLPAPDGATSDFIMSRPRRGGLKDETLLVTIQDEVPFQSFTLRTEPANANDLETPSVRIVFTLEPGAKGGITLSVEETLCRYTPGQRLAWWLSNDLSDHLHSMRAKIDGRSDGSIHGSQMIPKHRLDTALPGSA